MGETKLHVPLDLKFELGLDGGEFPGELVPEAVLGCSMLLVVDGYVSCQLRSCRAHDDALDLGIEH